MSQSGPIESACDCTKISTSDLTTKDTEIQIVTKTEVEILDKEVGPDFHRDGRRKDSHITHTQDGRYSYFYIN